MFKHFGYCVKFNRNNINQNSTIKSNFNCIATSIVWGLALIPIVSSPLAVFYLTLFLLFWKKYISDDFMVYNVFIKCWYLCHIRYVHKFSCISLDIFLLFLHAKWWRKYRKICNYCVATLAIGIFPFMVFFAKIF